MASRSKAAVLREIVSDHIQALAAKLELTVRRMVAEEARAHFSGRGRGGKRKNIVPCIAPRCRKPSKGPRFHFLCEDHRGAPKREYEKWQARARG